METLARVYSGKRARPLCIVVTDLKAERYYNAERGDVVVLISAKTGDVC